MEARPVRSSRLIEIALLCSSALSSFPLFLFVLHTLGSLDIFNNYETLVFRTFFLLPFVFLGFGLLSLFTGYLLRKELSKKFKITSVFLSLLGLPGFLLTWLVIFRLAAG